MTANFDLKVTYDSETNTYALLAGRHVIHTIKPPDEHMPFHEAILHLLRGPSS